jgi:glycosyltransferase involved in cell wall biosynthesis
MKSPRVSVIMSAFNAQDYISDAIRSILGQSYRDFEFIIIDDGSSDATAEIIATYQKEDERIRFKNRGPGNNKGMPVSLTEAVSMARGEYLARQDADDISFPHRLERQVFFLAENPQVGLLGSNIRTIDGNGKFETDSDLLTSPDDLKLAEIFSNQFGHGSVMIRKKILEEVGAYDPAVVINEDYDLWVRVSCATKVANLKECLYGWRFHQQNISMAKSSLPQKSKASRDAALKIRDKAFELYLADKKGYRFLSFHPYSMLGGVKAYLRRKSAVYSDMAIMYCSYGHRWRAILPVLLATLHTPWLKKPYRHLGLVLAGDKTALNSEYELF